MIFFVISTNLEKWYFNGSFFANMQGFFITHPEWEALSESYIEQNILKTLNNKGDVAV